MWIGKMKMKKFPLKMEEPSKSKGKIIRWNEKIDNFLVNHY